MFRAPGKEKRFRVRVVGVDFGGFAGCLGVGFRTHLKVFLLFVIFVVFKAIERASLKGQTYRTLLKGGLIRPLQGAS